MKTPEITLVVQKGIAAARSGRSTEARQLLQQAVETYPNNEMAWLWLSGLMATNEQKQICLEQVLRVNPENVYASAGLTRLQIKPETAPIEASVLQARLAFATSDFIKLPRTVPLNQAKSTTKPAIKRLKSVQSETNQPQAIKTVPQPAKLNQFETICPACDYPISPTANECPYCYIQLKSLEELLAQGKSSLPSTQPLKRKGILGLLGAIIAS